MSDETLVNSDDREIINVIIDDSSDSSNNSLIFFDSEEWDEHWKKLCSEAIIEARKPRDFLTDVWRIKCDNAVNIFRRIIELVDNRSAVGLTYREVVKDLRYSFECACLENYNRRKGVVPRTLNDIVAVNIFENTITWRNGQCSKPITNVVYSEILKKLKERINKRCRVKDYRENLTSGGRTSKLYKLINSHLRGCQVVTAVLRGKSNIDGRDYAVFKFRNKEGVYNEDISILVSAKSFLNSDDLSIGNVFCIYIYDYVGNVTERDNVVNFLGTRRKPEVFNAEFSRIFTKSISLFTNKFGLNQIDERIVRGCLISYKNHNGDMTCTIRRDSKGLSASLFRMIAKQYENRIGSKLKYILK